MLYLLHFDPKFRHAQHYLGFTQDGRIEARLAEHCSGKGARIVTAAFEAKCKVFLVRTWPEYGRTHERAFKRASHLKGLCPMCSPQLRSHYLPERRLFDTRREAPPPFYILDWKQPVRWTGIPFDFEKRPHPHDKAAEEIALRYFDQQGRLKS